MARNAAARNFLLSTVSKDEDEEKKYNSRTGKLRSEEAYTPKRSTAKAAEKISAPSLLSQGQRVDVVRDTGAKTILPGAKNAMEALLEQQRKSRSIRNEMNAIGKELRKSGATDFASYQAAAQKQMELQKQLPMASFAAGLLNSMGKAPAKIVANASGNEQLKNTWGKTLTQLQETQEANAGAGMAGAMTGELLKAGAGYATIGKAAEKKALDVAGKALGGRALTKGGEIATRMIGQTVADTAVNTPITVAAGLADEKSGKEIAKDVGKQVAMDAAFNVGLEGIGAAGRAAGKALEKTRTANASKVTAKTDTILQDYGITDIYSSSNVVNSLFERFKDTFVSQNNSIKPILNEATGLNIEIWKNGLNETFRKGGYYPALSEKMKIAKISSVEHLPELIRTGRVKADDVKHYDANAKSKFLYLENDINIDGEDYIVQIDVKKLPEGSNRFYIHSIKIKEAADASRDSSLSGPPLRKLPSAASTDIVADTAAEVNETAVKQALTEADLPELAKEYQLKSSDAYQRELMRQWAEKYGDGTKEYMDAEYSFLQELEDLQEMLGIRTRKVQDAERRMENSVMRNVKKSMSIFGQADTAEAKKLMKRAAREANRGKISEKTRNEIFESLFALGKESNSGSIDKGLKDRLRSLHLQISETDAANIPDFNLWKKGTMGKIGSITKAEKGNVDTVWEELKDEWPEWFPADIVNPGDQLAHIADVADEMKYHNIPISETMADEEKAMLREGFDRYMDGLETENSKLIRYKQDREEKRLRKILSRGALPDYSRLSTEDVKYMHDELYRLQKEYDRVERKVNLTAGDKSDLERLLRGEISEAQARERAGANADDLIAMYEVSLPLNRMKGSLEGYRQYVNGRYSDEMKNIIGEMDMRTEGKDGWQDIAMLRQARETQSRILDLVAPKKIAGRIKEKIFDPIHTSERDRTLFKNKYIDALKNTKISTKKDILIRMADGTSGTTSESALVQWLGEKRYQLLEMERKKGHATADDLQAELMLRSEIQAVEANLSAAQLKKIDNCIDEITKIYKEIHPKINETLIRNGYAPIGYIEGYFPHMNFDDPKGIGEKAASLLGFDFTSKELPMDIAGRTDTFRPGKKWAGNLLTRTGQQTDYDALRAFDLYIDNISDVIYHTDNIKRLRAYEDHIRYTLSDKGIQEAVDRIRQNPNLDEVEKAALIETEYAKNQEHTLQNYVNNIRLYTDLLAGKKHNADRIMENYVIGRKVYKVIDSIESKVAGNMVAGNIGSAMTNFIPITQGMSSMSVKSNLQGLKEALTYMGSREMDDLTKKSAFLTTREGSDLLYRTEMRKVGDLAGKPMELADKFSTQAVWRSRYYDNMAKGMTEDAAIKNADEFARNLFGGRSKGAMPTMMHSKTLKPLTMFQLEVNNQLSYLMKDIPKDAQGDLKKIFKAYSGIVIGAYIYNDVYEKLTGRRSALDPFGMANEAIGDYTGEKLRNIVDIGMDAATGRGLDLTEKTEKKKASVATEELMTNIGSNLPFIGGIAFDGGRIPIQSAIPHPVQALGSAFDLWQGETTPEKAGKDIYSDLSPALWYGLMPTAGGQLRKTVHGANTMAKGGRYGQTKDGPELQFAVDQEKPANWVQSLLFGQWATEEGKEYLENNKQKLGTNQTETYQKLVEAGAKNTLAFDEISRIRSKNSISEKRNAIRASMLNDEQKGILYYDMIASDTDKDVLDHFQGATNQWKIADCLSRMAEYDGTSAKRSVLRNAEISENEKQYIYLNKITQKDSREKEEARVAAVSSVGLSMDKLLNFRNKMNQVDESGMKSKEKQWAMVQWMRENGFTEAQMQVIRENYKFSGGYTIDWKY